MKIYTRTGDDGTTGLLGGGRISKGDPRIDCYGTLDELNAFLGWARGIADAIADVIADADTRDALKLVQDELFIIGSHLAVADGANPPATLPALEDSAIARLEMQIDAATARMPPLRTFILPGGCELAARLHIARTVCRRAERQLVAFSADRPVAALFLTYLNRLSDWLFVQARLANHRSNTPDVPWTGK